MHHEKGYLNGKAELISHWELLIQAIKIIFLTTYLVKFEAKMEILYLLNVKKKGSLIIFMKAHKKKKKIADQYPTMRSH